MINEKQVKTATMHGRPRLLSRRAVRYSDAWLQPSMVATMPCLATIICAFFSLHHQLNTSCVQPFLLAEMHA